LVCWQFACDLAKNTCPSDALCDFLGARHCLCCYEIAESLITDDEEAHPLAEWIGCLKESGWGDMIQWLKEYLD
jgi:hypothetical protein